jgi:hypothetical protein
MGLGHGGTLHLAPPPVLLPQRGSLADSRAVKVGVWENFRTSVESVRIVQQPEEHDGIFNVISRGLAARNRMVPTGKESRTFS